MLSPILLFVYNRPNHTQQTLAALSVNFLASESDLFIYSDAPKNQEAVEGVQTVRSLIKNVQGFNSVTIIERDKNWGLANSIIDGVTSIVNQYGKVIVLEDDMITSSNFLQFMNKALNYYENEKKVWHISGWNCLNNVDGMEDIFFWRVMNCWGWATWKDRWQYYEKDVDKLISQFTKKDIYRFNINGAENFWEQVLENKMGKINTWAIFWYATIFQKNGLCLSATRSFVRNIGLDGTGVHSGTNSIFSNDVLCEKDIDFNALNIQENKTVVKKIIHFYKKQKSLYRRIPRYAKKILKKLKTIIHKILNKLSSTKLLKITFHTSSLWCGNEYGGFYICPDILPSPNIPYTNAYLFETSKAIVYSAGIGEDISFDEAVLKEFNAKIFAFDPTPKSIEWIQNQKLSDNFLFYPYGISAKTENQIFHLPRNKNHVSGSIFTHEATSNDDCITVQMKSLEDIAQEHQHTYIDILKMDIEGSEFSIIENFPQNVVFGQILIEFHERFIKNGRSLLNKCIKTLKKYGYYCFAISKHGDEYSFINKHEYRKRLCGKRS